MSPWRNSDHGREPPGSAARANRRAGGAARWLALAVVTAAATWYGGGLAATPALADTTVAVTTTADETNPGDGVCSLREAILYAQKLNGGNTDCGTTATGTTTINVPAGTYDVPAVTAGSHLQIGPGGPGPIVIAGAGQTGTIIDAHNGGYVFGRVLLVGAGANVTIRNLALQGGVAFGGQSDGGGIDNLGTLTLDHVTVTGNLTTTVLGAFPGQDRGGGIFNTGTLLLLTSDISANSTAAGVFGFGGGPSCGTPGDAGSPGADGGGLYNQGGFAAVINTTIHGNATGGGGQGGHGADSRTVNYSYACKFGGDGGPAGPGGDGGGIYNSDGTVTLRNSAVYGNTTGAGGQGGTGGYGSAWGGHGGEAGQGGAGAGIASTGILTVINTTIANNTTGGGGPGGTGGGTGASGLHGLPGGGGAGGIGGGIIAVDGQATVQESTIAQNLTGQGLGTTGFNAGPGRGSGIVVWAGTLTEIDTIVAKNDCAVFAGQLKDGVAGGDGHLNLTFPATTTCPGILADPLLGPLTGGNGGPTPTMAIAPPSPAIGRILPTIAAGCTSTDQRGITRPQPAASRLCDIGAYEYKP